MSFPYRIFNDMSEKLKASEANIEEVKKYYEAKITAFVSEYEDKLGSKSSLIHPLSDQSQASLFYFSLELYVSLSASYHA